MNNNAVYHTAAKYSDDPDRFRFMGYKALDAIKAPLLSQRLPLLKEEADISNGLLEVPTISGTFVSYFSWSSELFSELCPAHVAKTWLDRDKNMEQSVITNIYQKPKRLIVWVGETWLFFSFQKLWNSSKSGETCL